MSQPITVTPKILRPAPPMTPGGFARGRGGFAPGFPMGGRGMPFTPPATGNSRKPQAAVLLYLCGFVSVVCDGF